MANLCRFFGGHVIGDHSITTESLTAGLQLHFYIQINIMRCDPGQQS